ncbi:MAG: hypothetical protein AAF961_05920 [Planctomycetota bacterium]
MPTDAPEPAQLHRDIAQLEADATRLQDEQSAAANEAVVARRKLRYLKAARQLRSPKEAYELWPLGALIVGPLVIGGALLAAVSLLFNSSALTAAAFAVGLVGGLLVFAALLYVPGDATISRRLPTIENQLNDRLAAAESASEKLAEVRKRLESHVAARRTLATEDKLQRAMLLQRDWKSMQGSEWEDFVVETCRTLGANVQRVPNQGQEEAAPKVKQTFGKAAVPSTGNALIVTFSPLRFAAATVTGVRPFHTAAAQQLVRQLDEHGCDATADFTNSRLTTGGKQLAAARNCTLIGEEEFPDFVLGKISLDRKPKA